MQTLNNINIYDVENSIKLYLIEKHPNHSNGFIIRLGDILENSFNRRRSYIIKFPYLSESKELQIEEINLIIFKWSEFALENIIINYDLNQLMTIISIDPLNIDKIFNNISIIYAGTSINPEDIIRLISSDIIEQMNKHLLELYMDETYPNIDITDISQIEQFNEIFDNISIENIYEIYKYADVYVPITLSYNNLENKDINSNVESNTIYLNGTINTFTKSVDIIDDIRICLDSDDTNENFKYIKEDIIFKFKLNNEIKSFAIITDPCI